MGPCYTHFMSRSTDPQVRITPALHARATRVARRLAALGRRPDAAGKARIPNVATTVEDAATIGVFVLERILEGERFPW